MKPLRILVVGGVAGGASAATRARRMNEQAEIVLLERGPEVSFANCGLPYYVGGKIRERNRLLVARAEDLRDKFRIDVRTGHEVLSIDRARHQVTVLNRHTGTCTQEPYDKLILAPGAAPVVPPWAGTDRANVFTLRDLADTDRITQFVDSAGPARAVVIGAGFIGLEMVENLTVRGLAVTVVEREGHVLPLMDAEMARRLESVLTEQGIELCREAVVETLLTQGDRVTAVRLADGRDLPADMVLISVGVRPQVELARQAGLALGPSGGIAVNAWMQTSDPDIYAVGDAAEVVHRVTAEPARIPLAGPANRNGRLAGTHAAVGLARPAAPVAGSCIVGLFGKAAAMTGLSLKAARQRGMDAHASYAIAGHHAGYYPGAEQMVLKLVFDRSTRKVLGAQAVGGAGVDKRIDVIATALHFGATVDDLAGLDLVYAPQFGSAKDPVHQAAFVAQNECDGLIRQILPGEPPVPDAVILDVRTEPEFAAGSLPGAVNIPLQKLRQNLDRLDRNRPVMVLCGIGQRAYAASRILMQSGFGSVWNLAGGYTLQKSFWSDLTPGRR